MNENPIFVLIKGIIGTYLNRLVEKPSQQLELVIDECLEEIKLPKDVMGDGGEGDTYQTLLETLAWLREIPSDTIPNRIDLIERIRMACRFQPEYIETVERLLKHIGEEKETVQRIRVVISELKHLLKKSHLSEVIRKANRDLNFGHDNLNVVQYVRALEEKIHEFTSVEGSTILGRAGGTFNTDEVETVTDAFRLAGEYESEEGRLKTGLKGLNRMFGGFGFRRGEQIIFSGLVHNYKSGILLDLGKWFCQFNRPHMIDPKKKPMVLHISFENQIEQNIIILYKTIWEFENQKRLNKAKIDPEKAAQYVIDKLGAKGYRYEMLYFNPNGMDVWDLIDIINHYTDNGYEIHGLCVDYPELICQASQANGVNKNMVLQTTFGLLRNHCFENHITNCVGAQLNTKALEIAREGGMGFAKRIAKGAYYKDSQAIAEKADGECVVHINDVDGVKYLFMGRGKHRGGEDTPISHQSCAYKFEEFGGICPDLNVGAPEGNAIYTFASIREEATGGREVDMSSAGEW